MPHPLSDLHEGTKRLLPLVRVCIDITVLGPEDVPRSQRQRGLLGNHITVPQANPSKVCATHPPNHNEPSNLHEFFNIVLVGSTMQNQSGARQWKVPRGQYTNAVRHLQASSLVYQQAVLDERAVTQPLGIFAVLHVSLNRIQMQFTHCGSRV